MIVVVFFSLFIQTKKTTTMSYVFSMYTICVQRERDRKISKKEEDKRVGKKN